MVVLRQLHYKLMSYVCMAISLFALIIISLSFFLILEYSKEKTILMIEQLMDTVETTASIAVYTNNSVIANDMVVGLLRNDSVFKVVVRGIESFQVEKQKNIVTEQETIHIVRALFSPFEDKELIGQLIIIPNEQFILKEANYLRYYSIANFLLLIIVTTLIILLVVRVYISKPLLEVFQNLDEIREGKKNRINMPDRSHYDELGVLVNTVNSLLEASDVKLIEEKSLRHDVQKVEKQLRYMFDASSAGLFLLDIRGKLITYNTTLLKILHFIGEPVQLKGVDFATYFFIDDHIFKQMMVHALSLKPLESHDFLLHRPKLAGSLWVQCLLSRVEEENGTVRIEGVLFDITQRVELEQASRYEADHDSLTDLLLRQAVRDQFDQYLLLSQSPHLSLFLLDLDGFKQINDTYGHDVGDKVLVETAQRLQQSIRSTDLVSRLGGDEFLVVIMDYDANSESIVAKNMIKRIQQPIVITDNFEISVGVSIGIANYSDQLNTFDTLTKAADLAMYEVKRKGKNGYGIEKDHELVINLL